MPGTKAYMVMGDRGGSGGQTWPEDFDIVGVYMDRDAAQKEADERNLLVAEEEGIDVPEGETFDPYDYDLMDVITYSVYGMPVLG